RSKARRRCQQDHIRQGNGFFVAVKSYKFMFFRYIYFFRMSLCNGGVTAVQSIPKGICHGHQLDVVTCSQSLEHSTCASSPAAYYGDFDLIRSCCISTRHSKGTQQSSPSQE